MLIDSLKASAFRGITGALDLDLKARLTLIYAPNGTGKTSVCDSLEWLLTGEVWRFKEALGGSSTGGVKNLFADLEPSVECELIIEGESVRVRRSAIGDSSHIERLTGGNWRRATLDSVLEKLTPKTLAANSNAVQRSTGRKRWFRAVRFLDTPSLDLLVDSSDDASEIRSLVFSELLGVGDLESDHRHLSKILKQISSKTQLNRELSETRTGIANLESEIRADAERASAPFFRTFEDRFAALSRHLKITSVDPARTQEQRLADAERIFGRESQRLDRLRLALTRVVAATPRHPDLLTRLQAQRNRHNELSRLRQELQRELTAAGQNEQRAVSERQRVEREANLLAEVRFDSIRGTLRGQLQQWAELGGDPQQPIQASNFQSELVRLREQQKRLRQAQKLTTDCRDSLPNWRESLRRKLTAEQNLTEVSLPSSEELAASDTLASETEASIRQLNVQYERLSGPLERLRSAGHEFLSDAPLERKCPFCDHDHGSPSGLADAVAKGLAALPIAVATLSEQIRSQEAKLTELRNRRTTWDEARRRERNARAAITREQSLLQEADEALAAIGLNSNQLSDPNVQETIQGKERQIEADLAAINSSVAKTERLSVAAVAMIRVAEAIEGINAEMRRRIPDAQPLQLSTVQASLWASLLERDSDVAQVAKDKCATLLADHAEKIESLRAGKAELAGKIQRIDEESQQVSRTVTADEVLLRDFQEDWTLLGGGDTWSPEKFEGMPSQVELQLASQTNAKVELDLARSALQSARAAEAVEREQNTRQRRLGELRANIKKLNAVLKLREQCENGLKAIDTARGSFIEQQVKPLCQVISTLYVRAQGNRFIDGIGTNPEEGSLQWQAKIADLKLEDPVQMSQGQRQDLALAIFLARARELGGTFFLDEPLLHLDDLNRVALLDVLRVIIAEERAQPLRLVVTTASAALVRHCREKFALVKATPEEPAIRVWRLHGNPQAGVTAVEEK